MKSIQILVVGNLDRPSYYEILSSFLAKEGFKLNIQNVGPTPEELAELIQFKFNSADCVLVESSHVELVYSHMIHVPSEAYALRAIDSLFLQNGKYWPKVLLKQVAHNLIVSRGKCLDFKAKAVVVGAGYRARVAASVLFWLGYREVVFVTDDQQSLALDVESLQKHFFGLSIESLSYSELILQPGLFSIMVKCIDVGSADTRYQDLLYFNYLLPGALILDLGYDLHDHILFDESKAIGMTFISTQDVATHYAATWLLSLSPLQNLSYDKLTSELSAYMAEHLSRQ